MVLLQNQLILGVMGVDVAISEIKKKTPTYRVSRVNITIITYVLMNAESHLYSAFPYSSELMATPLPSIPTATYCCTPTCDPKYVQQQAQIALHLMSLRASDPVAKFGCFSSWLALTLPARLSSFLSLFRSLTSGSPSLWTFWMQSWKTATRRRLKKGSQKTSF